MLDIVPDVTHRSLVLSTLQSHTETMMKRLRVDDQDVAIVLMNNAEIRKLNRAYRGKDKPTDVLSFSMKEGEFADMASNMLGDIVVSIEMAAKQAAEKRHSLQYEVSFLVAHGLLHLMGYDHENDADENAMNAKTDAIMKGLVEKSEPKSFAKAKNVKKMSAAKPKQEKQAAPSSKKITRKVAKKTSALVNVKVKVKVKVKPKRASASMPRAKPAPIPNQRNAKLVTKKVQSARKSKAAKKTARPAKKSVSKTKRR
jgi:probable rRNA maturation factor